MQRNGEKMKDIRFSIVVPVYNVELYLEKCLKSIISQSYKNFEIIVVNDGSTDSSRAICEKYGQLYDNVKVLNKKNEGLSYARRDGFLHATGDYILFVDSDDFINDTYLENAYKNIKVFKSDIVLPNILIRYSKKDIKFQTNLENNKIYNKEEILTELVLGKNLKDYVWGKIYKRTIINEKFFSEIQIFEDVLFTYKVIRFANSISTNFEMNYYYVQRNNSILTSPFTKEKLVLLDNVKAMCMDLSDESFLKQPLEYRWFITNKMIMNSIIQNNKKDDFEFEKAFNKVKKVIKKTSLKNKYLNKKEKIYIILVRCQGVFLLELFNLIRCNNSNK